MQYNAGELRAKPRHKQREISSSKTNLSVDHIITDGRCYLHHCDATIVSGSLVESRDLTRSRYKVRSVDLSASSRSADGYHRHHGLCRWAALPREDKAGLYWFLITRFR
ncbi:hypothetical protein J6590_008036 [Homalodisca vitripennis]|nr:hypothetical protein J6590_008036 [Homalodisca vitripennis]